MTVPEQILTVAAAVAATMLTRFLPFVLIGGHRKTPPYIKYLGKVLPCAVFAMLVVYCLRNVDLMAGNGAPEFLSIAVTTVLHLVKRQMLLSIAGGTIFYMLLVQFVFCG